MTENIRLHPLDYLGHGLGHGPNFRRLQIGPKTKPGP